MLTYKEAQTFYDSFGRKQERQFYEESAINDLIAHGRFRDAENIVEFGCGTGKLALRLFLDVLPAHCQYVGVDISRTMIDLCQDSLRPYAGRAKCMKNEGHPILNLAVHSADRFISTYVLDLLSAKDIDVLLSEAHRILVPGGLLCLACLTHGVTLLSRMVERGWRGLYKLSPSLVGGCRPVDMAEHLRTDRWHIVHDALIESYAVPSEVLIAKKR